MSRWSRGSRAPVAPAPGMILPGVPMAGPTSVEAVAVPLASDPLAGPAPSLIDRVEVPVSLVMPDGVDPLDAEIVAELSQVAGGAHRVWTPASPVSRNETAVRSDDPAIHTDADTDEVVEAVVVEPSPRGALSDNDPTSSAEVPASTVEKPTEPTSSRDDGTNVLQGPWPDPDGPGWPREVPPWGAAPSGYGRPLSAAVLVFTDGTAVPAEPAEAQRLRAVAQQLGA